MILTLSNDEKKHIIRLLQNEDTKASQKLVKRIEKSMQKIKPRSAKNKGMEWQKEVCAIISQITGIEYNQQDDNCLIHSRESGLNGVDVILRGEAKNKFPFCVECKNENKISLPEWTRQAENNCDDLNNWILFVKSPVLPARKVVVIPLDRFIGIMKPH